jgi:hypothetical protein
MHLFFIAISPVIGRAPEHHGPDPMQMGGVHDEIVRGYHRIKVPH